MKVSEERRYRKGAERQAGKGMRPTGASLSLGVFSLRGKQSAPGYRAKLDFARELRRRATPSERILWEHLRCGRLDGWKFRRQHLLWGWIPDFFCPRAGLVIEIDGGYHTTDRQMARDAYRDSVLAGKGYVVLRFTNEDVDQRAGVVVDRIQQALDGIRPLLRSA